MKHSYSLLFKYYHLFALLNSPKTYSRIAEATSECQVRPVWLANTSWQLIPSAHRSTPPHCGSFDCADSPPGRAGMQCWPPNCPAAHSWSSCSRILICTTRASDAWHCVKSRARSKVIRVSAERAQFGWTIDGTLGRVAWRWEEDEDGRRVPGEISSFLEAGGWLISSIFFQHASAVIQLFERTFESVTVAVSCTG